MRGTGGRISVLRSKAAPKPTRSPAGSKRIAKAPIRQQIGGYRSMALKRASTAKPMQAKYIKTKLAASKRAQAKAAKAGKGSAKYKKNLLRAKKEAYKAATKVASKKFKAAYGVRKAGQGATKTARYLGPGGMVALGVGTGIAVIGYRLYSTVENWEPGAVMEAVMDDPIILIAVFMVIALIAWYILRRRKSG